jgi:tRNA (guanine-N7-)-methyltransferase
MDERPDSEVDGQTITQCNNAQTQGYRRVAGGRPAQFTNSTAPSTGRAGRSFRPRTGRLSPTKRRALAETLPRYLVEPQINLNATNVFGRMAPVFVDIGFGMGDSTLALAAERPDANIYAIDVHVDGHANLALALKEGGIANVRIVACDAHEAMMWMIPAETVTEVHIWFPDPWQKVAQKARRLVAPDFLTVVASTLIEGGVVRMATDWQPYADQMLTSIDEVDALTNPNSSPGWAPRHTGRPITSYEQKGLDARRTIRDLVAIRR